MTAVSQAGNTKVSSDGVTIVTENAVLSGVMIYDGVPCNMTGWYQYILFYLHNVLGVSILSLFLLKLALNTKN